MDLMATIIEILRDLPDLKVLDERRENRIDEYRWDAVVQAEVKGQPVCLLVEAKSSGYPRDMQRAIWQLADIAREASPSGRPNVPIVAAPSISETSRELLREHGLGYVDAGGSVYINLPQSVYWVDRPAPPGSERSLRNVYNGSSARVLHALLLAPDRPWHINELAELAGVAHSTAYQVCRHLEQQLLMEKSGKGPATVRLLREPGKLLDDWADSHSLADYAVRRFHRWTRDPRAFAQVFANALESAGVEYALTLSSGVELVAPYATGSSRFWALVSSSTASRLDNIAQEAGLQSVDEGESVNLLETEERSPLLFRRQVGDLWVASDIQLYLDLWAWPQRGKEQARHLRAERMEF